MEDVGSSPTWFTVAFWLNGEAPGCNPGLCGFESRGRLYGSLAQRQRTGLLTREIRVRFPGDLLHEGRDNEGTSRQPAYPQISIVFHLHPGRAPILPTVETMVRGLLVSPRWASGL